VPSTMIFLRSPGGISHHPDETVRPQDVEHALAAGLKFLRLFVTHDIAKEQSTPHA
jgi:allantoate deiminase